MSNPLDDYFMEKQASSLKTLRDNIGPAAIQAGVGAGLLALPAVASKVMYAVTKHRSYNQMMDQNPDLQDAKEDLGPQFNNFYNSFHRLNPEFASDPTVAGAYMRKMVGNPATAGGTIVESLGHKKNLGSSTSIGLKFGPRRDGEFDPFPNYEVKQ